MRCRKWQTTDRMNREAAVLHIWCAAAFCSRQSMHTLPDETVQAKIQIIQAQAVVRGEFMQIVDLQIRNFKSIRALHMADIENALILVGKNDTGKTARELNAFETEKLLEYKLYQLNLDDFCETCQ